MAEDESQESKDEENAAEGKVFCRNCGESIDEKAEICPECGVRQKSNKAKNPGVAALASFILPGAGQVYNGDIAKGIFILLLWGFSGLLSLVLIGLITTPIIWLFAIYDAYNSASSE